jgi:integrase
VLLLTGQRRGEVAGMRWSELKDIDTQNAIWVLPSNRTKNKQSHLVPLTPSVRELILDMPRVSQFVFTTTGKTPVSGFGKVKKRLDARINQMTLKDELSSIPHWTVHDLRRTMVTHMNEKLGIPPHVVEAVVNHSSGLAKAGVAGVYNRALYLEDRRQALHKWQSKIGEIRCNQCSNIAM